MHSCSGLTDLNEIIILLLNVFTVRALVTDSGRPDTSELENGLNDLIKEVSLPYPTLSFSPVMRFGT